MSDDKQLTVAELLARAGKEKSDGDGAPGSRGAGKDGSDKPRRRRRRSMEDGGVSVAELTGSFPKVKAKPKESKHGSPIDEASGEQAGKKPAPGAATPATPSSKEKTSQGTDGRSQSSRTGAGSGRATQPGKQAADSAGAQPADSGKNAGKSDSAGSGKIAGKGASSGKTKPVDGATGADKTVTKQQDSRTKTKSFTVNRKPAEQTPTKGSEKASSTSNKATGASGAASGSTLKSGAAAKPGFADAAQSAKSGQQDKPGSQGSATKPADAAKSVPEKPSPASDETAEISRVTDAHAEQEQSSKDEGDTVTTGEIPKVDSAGRATSTAKQQAGQRASDDTSEFQSVDDAAAQSAPGASSAQKSKNKQKSGGFGSPIPSAAEQREQEAPVHAGPDVDAGTDAENDESIAEGEGMNPLAVVLLALTGIILGVVVFKGFEMLWGSLNNFLVAALAVGVTGVMAGIVHALRTERDGLSMTLAVIVGLLLTFGPAVLVVL